MEEFIMVKQKRILAFLLTLVMIMTMVPMIAMPVAAACVPCDPGCGGCTVVGCTTSGHTGCTTGGDCESIFQAAVDALPKYLNVLTMVTEERGTEEVTVVTFAAPVTLPLPAGEGWTIIFHASANDNKFSFDAATNVLTRRVANDVEIEEEDPVTVTYRRGTTFEYENFEFTLLRREFAPTFDFDGANDVIVPFSIGHPADPVGLAIAPANTDAIRLNLTTGVFVAPHSDGPNPTEGATNNNFEVRAFSVNGGGRWTAGAPTQQQITRLLSSGGQLVLSDAPLVGGRPPVGVLADATATPPVDGVPRANLVTFEPIARAARTPRFIVDYLRHQDFGSRGTYAGAWSLGTRGDRDNPVVALAATTTTINDTLTIGYNDLEFRYGGAGRNPIDLLDWVNHKIIPASQWVKMKNIAIAGEVTGAVSIGGFETLFAVEIPDIIATRAARRTYFVRVGARSEMIDNVRTWFAPTREGRLTVNDPGRAPAVRPDYARETLRGRAGLNLWFTSVAWDRDDVYSDFATPTTILTASGSPLAITVSDAGGRINSLSRDDARAVINIGGFLREHETYVYAWNGASARQPASQISTVKLAPRAVIAQEVPISVTAAGRITWPTITVGGGVPRPVPFNFRMTAPAGEDIRWGRNVRFGPETMAALNTGTAPRARIPNTARPGRAVDGVTGYTGFATSSMTTFRIGNTKTTGNNPRDIAAPGVIHAINYPGLLVLGVASTTTINLSTIPAQPGSVTVAEFPLRGVVTSGDVEVSAVTVSRAGETVEVAELVRNHTIDGDVVRVNITIDNAREFNSADLTVGVTIALAAQADPEKYHARLSNATDARTATATIRFERDANQVAVDTAVGLITDNALTGDINSVAQAATDDPKIEAIVAELTTLTAAHAVTISVVAGTGTNEWNVTVTRGTFTRSVVITRTFSGTG
jgi:hypothetical protein